MSDKNKKTDPIQPVLAFNTPRIRKSYQKPKLEKLGDLRTLTLAYSGGIDESGSGGLRGRLPSGAVIPPGFPQPEGLPGDDFIP